MKRSLFYLFCSLSFVLFAACGPDDSRPSEIGAVTGDVTHISCRNAEIAGKVNIPGTAAPYLTFGVLYSTNSDVSRASATKIQAKSFDSDCNYTVNTRALEPETVYYYRSYIIAQNNEIIYGETKSFKTLALSSMIKTEDATEIDAVVATFNATLDLTDCKYDAIEYGFKLTSQGGLESLFKASNLSDKSFSYKAETLVSDKQYNVAAYVTIDGSTYTAESKSFITQSLKASVTLNEETDITEFKATVSGILTVESQGQFSKSAKLYYRDSNGTAEDLKANGKARVLILESDGRFSLSLENLKSGEDYYYVVIATVDGVDVVSEVKHFTTASIGVSVEALDATYITEFRGTLNGKLTVTSIENVSKEVWFRYSTTQTTAEALKSGANRVSASLKSNGTFCLFLTDLKENTTYYYIACAKVNGKEYISEVNHFTTASIGVSVDALDATNIDELGVRLNGELTVTSIDKVDVGFVGFYYSATATTVETLKSQGIEIGADRHGDGSFCQRLTELAEDTEYYYIAVAHVNGKRYYSGEMKSFKTPDSFTAEVLTDDASKVTFSSAMLNGTLSVESIASLTKEVWFLYGETATTVDALKLSGTRVSATLYGDSFSSYLSGLDDRTTYYFVACSKVHNRVIYGTVHSFNTSSYPMPTAVDMGLSVKWGSFNIGASEPEGYGRYYAWGETKPKSTYDWSTYTLCQGSYSTMTKYCTSSSYGTVDNKTTLENADDVAAQKLGGNWRMPTDAEWTELCKTINCSWTWENSKKGYRVTSKKTGNSIFLPAAGYYNESNHYPVGGSGYYYGCYWSSSLYSRNESWSVFFNSSDVNGESESRSLGLSVRPVCD